MKTGPRDPLRMGIKIIDVMEQKRGPTMWDLFFDIFYL